MKTLDLRNNILSTGKGHFHFEVGGRRFAYAYIRKNACSAFKDLICDTSTLANYAEFKGSHLDFMGEHHKIRTADMLDSCDTKIFVYRDPFERVISVFVNKFVVQTGNTAIFDNYRAALGKNPQNATFENFVKEYCRDFRKRDVHIERQSQHLLPVRYDAALDMGSLHAGMADLIGVELADRYFAHKVNSSTYGTDNLDKSQIKARDLHNHYKTTSELPSKHAFMRDDLIAICQRRYDMDYKMLSKIA